MKTAEEWLKDGTLLLNGTYWDRIECVKSIQSDAIESTVRKCAEMIKHKCDQWPCFDSEYCRSRTDAVNEILSLITQKEKKV